MRIIKIGRDPNNDVIVNDVQVSRNHCQIIQDWQGNYTLVDLNSTNGTYVNGIRLRGEVRLTETDVVKIGNTNLPWINYFPPINKSINNLPSSSTIIPPRTISQKSALGVIALILSLIGAGLLMYVAILVMKWGIFAWIGSASTYTLVSVGINILAFVLASIAEYNKDYDENDDTIIEIARFISGFSIFLVIGFFIYWKFIDPHLMNPFR